MRGVQRHRRGALGLGALVLVLALALSPAAASAASGSGESTGYNAVTGIGAAFCNVVYSPLKIAYAVGGTVVSGLAWIFTIGDADIAGQILAGSVRGDYVVTPQHLEGRRDLRFVGSRD